MKLLIDQELKFSTTFYPGATDEELDEYSEFFEFVNSVMNKYNVAGYVDHNGSGATVIINVQKITLDEFDMNSLFDGVLNNLFKLKIDYANLGGAGCDFALLITDSKQLDIF